MLAETRRFLFVVLAIGTVACATVAEPSESREPAAEPTGEVVMPVDDSVRQEPDLPYREIMQRRAAAHRTVQSLQSKPLSEVEIERIRRTNPRLLEAPGATESGPVGGQTEVAQ